MLLVIGYTYYNCKQTCILKITNKILVYFITILKQKKLFTITIVEKMNKVANIEDKYCCLSVRETRQLNIAYWLQVLVR